MTTCSRCRKKFDPEAARCPFCGELRPEHSGMFRTSTVLISVGSDEHVYRTVEDVPPLLRRSLLKSTNGANSATILIADRRGRQEIARALRKLPASTQRRLRRSMGERRRFRQLSPDMRKRLLAFAVLVLLVLIGIVFSHRW